MKQLPLSKRAGARAHSEGSRLRFSLPLFPFHSSNNIITCNVGENDALTLPGTRGFAQRACFAAGEAGTVAKKERERNE